MNMGLDMSQFSYRQRRDKNKSKMKFSQQSCQKTKGIFSSGLCNVCEEVDTIRPLGICQKSFSIQNFPFTQLKLEYE